MNGHICSDGVLFGNAHYGRCVVCEFKWCMVVSGQCQAVKDTTLSICVVCAKATLHNPFTAGRKKNRKTLARFEGESYPLLPLSLPNGRRLGQLWGTCRDEASAFSQNCQPHWPNPNPWGGRIGVCVGENDGKGERTSLTKSISQLGDNVFVCGAKES